MLRGVSLLVLVLVLVLDGYSLLVFAAVILSWLRLAPDNPEGGLGWAMLRVSEDRSV
jgi:hypothetical protein